MTLTLPQPWNCALPEDSTHHTACGTTLLAAAVSELSDDGCFYFLVFCNENYWCSPIKLVKCQEETITKRSMATIGKMPHTKPSFKISCVGDSASFVIWWGY